MTTNDLLFGTSNRRRVSVLAWVWCGAIIIAALVTAAVALTRGVAAGNVFEALGSVTTLVTSMAFGVTGALVLSRQPRNTVGWLLMLEGSLAILWPLDVYFNGIVQPPAHPSALFMLALWFWGWLWLWYIFPILFIPLFFPSGRLPSRRWRWVVALGLALCAFFILFVTFAGELGAQDGSWMVRNPIGFLTEDAFPFPVWAVLLLSFAGMSVASLFVRYRRASLMTRSQIKWLLYAAALFFLIYAVSFVFNNTSKSVDQYVNIAISFGVLMFPAAIAIAILRYRLYDIDIIIRRTAVYAVLTGLLALVYFGSVVLLQQAFGKLTGVEQSPLAIVISTLVIAALFTPLRRRIQEWIDRRFFRKKYNAEQVLAAFALTARDETDLDALTAELVRVVQETMEPESVSVWLLDHEDAK